MSAISSLQSDLIMKLAYFFIATLACCAMANAQVLSLDYCSGRLPAPEKAKCIKQRFEERKNDKEYIKITKKLLQGGDKHYRKRSYYKAYRDYDLANAYLATPYAYLRGSEAVFFSYMYSKHFEDDNAKSTGSCLLPSSFVWVVDDTLQKDYKVGLELVKIHQYGPAVSPEYLAEAEKRISCLDAMATQYRNVKTGCVDIGKLKACMAVKK